MSKRSGSETRQLSAQVGVRFTPGEREVLQKWADAWMISVPDLIRTVVFDSEFCVEFLPQTPEASRAPT